MNIEYIHKSFQTKAEIPMLELLYTQWNSILCIIKNIILPTPIHTILKHRTFDTDLYASSL